MSAEELSQIQQYIRYRYDVIVIGMGPVGLHFVEQLTKSNEQLTIAIFGDEPWLPYDRVKLSSLVSGEIKEEALYSSSCMEESSAVSVFYHNRVTGVDRYQHGIIDSEGKRYGYRYLVLATGSRAHIPSINGHNLKNVFCFRDLNDASLLMGRSVMTRRTIVIGGGLLGLEAAKAMQRFNTEVHVVEHEMHLLFKQLDAGGAECLTAHVNNLGIHTHVGKHVKEIKGDVVVEAVELSDGTVIDCDTIVIATGIIPNVGLAIESGLAIGRGITVNDSLCTNDESVYAIGECAEHRGQTYGLVTPGFDQASVLADIFCGRRSQYKGSIAATQLKVVGLPVFSVGEKDSSYEYKTYVYEKNNQYRKIITKNGRLFGVVGVGDWPGIQRFQEAVEKQRRVWPWQVGRFIKQGLLWNHDESENVAQWPAIATICNCRGVKKSEIDKAFKDGANTVEDLMQVTGASTVCGSCNHLLCDYMGRAASSILPRGGKWLLMASLISFLIVFLVAFASPVAYTTSVQMDWHIDTLWRSGTMKQISGYSILAVAVLISLISFRKRIPRLENMWKYTTWRITHVVVGMVVAISLIFHTGFRIGNELNYYLMLVFTALLFVGAVAALIIAIEHKLSARLAKQIRAYSVWLHIILLWPLPGLLGFHIFKTYYF